MKATLSLLLLASLLVLLAPGTAGALPPGEGGGAGPGAHPRGEDFFNRVVEKHRTAKEEYRAMREKRLKALNRIAARDAAPSDRVPGWKEQSRPVPVPADDPTDTKGLYLLLIVGGGVILSLTLRLLTPWLFDRKPPGFRAGEPMIIKLKPREERRLGRS